MNRIRAPICCTKAPHSLFYPAWILSCACVLFSVTTPAQLHTAQTSYQIEMTIWVTRVGGQGNIDLAVAASLVIKWLCQILPNEIFLLNISVSFQPPSRRVDSVGEGTEIDWREVHGRSSPIQFSLGCGAVLMVDTEANEAQTQEQILQLLESHNYTEGIYTVAAKPGSIRIQPIASTTGQVTPVTIFSLPVTTATSTAGQTSAVPGLPCPVTTVTTTRVSTVTETTTPGRTSSATAASMASVFTTAKLTSAMTPTMTSTTTSTTTSATTSTTTSTTTSATTSTTTSATTSTMTSATTSATTSTTTSNTDTTATTKAVTTTTQNTNSATTEPPPQNSSLFQSTPRPAHTSMATPRIPGPSPTLQVNFYKIGMNVLVSNAVTNLAFVTEKIIIWLKWIFPEDKMTVSHLIVSDDSVSRMPSGYGTDPARRSLRDHRRRRQTLTTTASYGCKILLQVTSEANEAETKELIKRVLIQNSNYTDGLISVRADPASIHIQLIDPGACPPEVTHSFSKGNYTWPEIKAGHTASLGCTGNPNHFAMRKCDVNGETDRAKWDNPMLKSCPTVSSLPNNIVDLEKVDVTTDNALVVAELIKNLTSNSPKMNLQEVEIVVSKVVEVMKVGEVTPSLGLTIVDIVTNIMETESNLQPVANQILEITESIGNTMSFDGESVSITSPMLALTVLNINSSQFDGLAFGVTSFIQGHDLQTFINQDPFDDTVAYISLPRSLEKHLFQQRNRTMARVQFTFYGKTVLFQDSILRDRILNTYVVSASVTNVTIRDLTDPVTITLQHLKPNQYNESVECVFWDLNGNNGLGGWSSEGCRMNSTSLNHTTCLCDHLTHFGVLMDLSRTPISALDDRIMTMITYVGCGLSSIFLTVTLLSYIAFDKLRRDYPSKILMNLSAALLLLNLLFLINTWLASFGNHGLCICLAVTLHYSLLASFTWMLLAAVHMYFALVKVFNIYVHSYILKLCSIGWGVPLVVVSIVLAINKDFYGSGVSAESVSPDKTPEDVFCWVQDNVAFYVSVVAYFLLILVCNLAVFIVVLVQIHSLKARNPAGSQSGHLSNLKSVVSLTFLLGLTWGFGCFAWGPAKVPFLYLFSICNSLQGFFIFVFHCLLKENVRKQWRIHLCCGRFRLNEYSDWSRSGTNGRSRANQAARSPSVKSVKSHKSNSTSSTSNGSDSGRKLISTVGSHLDLVYENPLAASSTSSSPSFPSVFRVQTNGLEVHCQQPSWKK